MTLSELRQKYLDFFKSKGHEIIPSASLIPENDPTALFAMAGMFPLVPYLLGQPHPMGARLASSQKCIRTGDIEEVGDNRHLTFFEMLGNWSLGDYFKPEAISWSFEFMISPEWLGLNPNRLYVTVFEGDENSPRDEESIAIWQAQFEVKGIVAAVGVAGRDEPVRGNDGPRIYTYPKEKNWWGPAGQTGPCGPDTEMFYDTGKEHDQSYGPVCHPNCDCGRFIEIWNDVFMQYEKKADGSYVPLAQKNVDTGMGLERTAAMLAGVPTVFDIQDFQVIIGAIEDKAKLKYSKSVDGFDSEAEQANRSFRIIADHIRAATFIIGDQRGVVPSNVGQGYVVRRLIRRAVREGKRLGISDLFLAHVALVVIGLYGGYYSELETNRQRIVDEISKEEEKFAKTIEKGLKEFERMSREHMISGAEAFILFSTYGFPLELTQELVQEAGAELDVVSFQEEFKKHQELSRAASAGAFKGGLADHSEETTRLHTATHLLHQALRQVLGEHVAQKGSNITAERLRFDFSHGQKMTPEEIKKVEDIVNDVIKRDLPVTREEMTVDEAKAAGAIGLFEQKYGEKVSVYTVEGFSKEICGGPHVTHAGELGSFKILKEEAVSSGVRRIKANIGI
ncbi:MAG: alanine--tRNA ligase [Patescibacteria group bacterium]|nr:alanine--tRNA ligase [Patescibacteria group bacterium]